MKSYVKNHALAALLAVMTPSAAFAGAPMTTATTDIGTLLDNPAAKAVLEKHLPALVSNPQFAQARSLTLKAVQGYAPDMLPDSKLAAIDAELAKLPAK
ncbi:MAG: hypothetical protein QM676_08315 [Novosphingobium sp.]